jgi:hypothetical protein
MSPPGIKEAKSSSDAVPSGGQGERFLPQVREFIDLGDRQMAEKNYQAASQHYFVAHQVEGLKGTSNLRMTGALIGMGRFTDGIYHLRYYIESGGKVYPEGFRLPEDPAWEDNMGNLLKRLPHDNDILISAAVHAYAKGDLTRAAEHITTLRTVNPYHPVLPALERALQTNKGKR